MSFLSRHFTTLLNVQARRNGRKSKKTDSLKAAIHAGCSVRKYSELNQKQAQCFLGADTGTVQRHVAVQICMWVKSYCKVKTAETNNF